MKKAAYLVVALIAFVIGIFVYYVRPAFVPISLSELRGNESKYTYLKIKVAGKLEVVEEEARYYIALKDWENQCPGESMCFQRFMCYQSLIIPEELKAQNFDLIKELAEKNKTFGKTNFIRGDYLAEVEITGELIEGRTILGVKTYDLKVEEIKQISPIKFFTLKEMGLSE